MPGRVFRRSQRLFALLQRIAHGRKSISQGDRKPKHAKLPRKYHPDDGHHRPHHPRPTRKHSEPHSHASPRVRLDFLHAERPVLSARRHRLAAAAHHGRDQHQLGGSAAGGSVGSNDHLLGGARGRAVGVQHAGQQHRDRRRRQGRLRPRWPGRCRHRPGGRRPHGATLP